MGDLTEEQVKELKENFAMFDKDGSGNIDRGELRAALATAGLNPTENDIKEMIQEADLDDDGKVSFNEFCKMMTGKMLPDDERERKMREAFSMFDKDGNGKISRDELMRVLVDLGDDKFSNEEAEEMIQAADIDGDGNIDYNEFVKMICAK